MEEAKDTEAIRRLCFVSPSAYPLLAGTGKGALAGGAEAQLCTVGRELSRQGFEVHFVVGDCGQSETEHLGGVTAHKTLLRYIGGSKRHMIPDWWNLFRLLAKIDAEFYFIKVPQHLLFLLGLYCKLYRRKLVFVGQKDSDLDKMVYSEAQGRVSWLLFSNGIRMTSEIAAQTEVQQLGFQEVFGKHARVIRNVLTLEADTAVKKEGYVLWVGNSTMDKQPHLVPEIARALPGIRFRMIMALAPSRPDDSFITENLEDLPNLEYLGEVPFSDIAQHYKGALLFISTSKCEGFPNTFLQSWQYKTPVVSLKIDPDNVITSFRLGRLSGTVEKMIEDISELYNDNDEREAAGERASEYAHEYHSLETALAEYRKLLEAG